MASNGVPVSPPVTRIVQGNHASTTTPVQKATGKVLPPGGHVLPAQVSAVPASVRPPVSVTQKPATPAASAKSDADLSALIAHLNKALNDSGKPNQFRVDSSSGGKLIQEVNPANGEVIGEYSVAEFPALAQGLGVSGLVIDSHA